MMDTKQQPYFFYDEKFKSDVVKWKELLDKSFIETERLKENEIVGKKSLNEEESEMLIAYCTTVLNANNLFLSMVNNILQKTTGDKILNAEYSSFTMPSDKVIQCQIFQYILPDLSMKELLRMVEMQKDTVNFVVEWVKKTEREN